MAHDVTKPDQTDAIDLGAGPSGAQFNEPLPTANDPGGAHAKGYSAEPGPAPVVKQDPVPLAPAPDTEPAVHQPELEGKVRPTGRRGETGYSPNDRLMGSDR
jgi:hypothetical protein